jgi:hypothetical protein
MTFFYNVGMNYLANADLDLATADTRVLLLTVDDDGNATTQKSRATVAAILASAATEATGLANYAREALASQSVDTDETSNEVEWSADDVTWTALGTDETLNAAIVYLHVGADSANIPICHYSGGFPVDANGEDFHLRWNGSVAGAGGVLAVLRHPSA